MRKMNNSLMINSNNNNNSVAVLYETIIGNFYILDSLLNLIHILSIGERNEF